MILHDFLFAVHLDRSPNYAPGGLGQIRQMQARAVQGRHGYTP
jgi:hypothetical protein